MTPQEFENLVSRDPALAGPLRLAAEKMRPLTRDTFASPLELVSIAALFPLVTFVIKNIGLPWLHEAARYSELYRQKFHLWIDDQYQKHGINPDQLAAAGQTLRQELESLTEKSAQQSWQRLADLFKNPPSDD